MGTISIGLWASPSAILVCVSAAVQSAKGLSEVEDKLEGVVITFSASHITGLTAPKPITEKLNNNNSTNGEIDRRWIEINYKRS